MDWFTKYVRLIPLKDGTTKHLCKTFSGDIFKSYRAPRKIWTDNGSQFICKDFKNLLNINGMIHIRTPYYHPQANPTERVNRVVRASFGDSQSL